MCTFIDYKLKHTRELNYSNSIADETYNDSSKSKENIPDLKNKSDIAALLKFR